MEKDYPPKRLDRTVYSGSLLPTRLRITIVNTIRDHVYGAFGLCTSLRELLIHDVHLSDLESALAEFSLI